ncbi:MAG: tripartite tricarboxylate transporter substrate-binding protein [Variovorax sp.]
MWGLQPTSGHEVDEVAGLGLGGHHINHVPYRGGGTLLNDLLAGHIQFGFTTVPTMVDHIRVGTVRALAVTGARRAPQLPDVPTMQEAGLPSVDATPIFGLIGPAKLPPTTVALLSLRISAKVTDDFGNVTGLSGRC